MTATEHREDRRASWLGQLAGARLVLLAAAIVLVSFAAAGVLSLAYAAVGLAIVAAAALIADIARPRLPSAVPMASRADAQIPTEAVDAMLAALPDPVVALDRDGIVVAFNARASALAPALRRGEPASFALRMPEVVEA
ncbi:MAG: two-component sensor histidine kinase, partial [Xanthobacteraceae bacterium]